MGYGINSIKTFEHLITQALHHQGKTFTTQIESLSFRFRHYQARLHVRTLCYSKSKRMLEISLKLIIYKLNNALSPTPKFYDQIKTVFSFSA